MIVRISSDSQYRFPDDMADELNGLDNEIVQAVEARDEAKFQETFDKMIELVTSNGQQLADDELIESDVILPPKDVTFEEAREEFTGEGVIPD